MLVRPIHPFNSVLPEIPGGIILEPSDILRDTNPHVLAHPDMFVEVEETFRGPHGLNDVEEATAKPGQKRNR
jgi:hypothetical protein